MNLRTKATLFFGVFLFTIAISVIFYAEYVVGNIFKKQTTDNLRIIAEQSESAYLSFLGSMKVRVLDWTSDNTIREITKGLLAAPEGSSEREHQSKEFTTYLNEKKMPFDRTIILADLLDKNGVVIASTEPKRIGQDERAEEIEHRKVHDIDKTINSNFGEVYFGTIVLNGEDGHQDPMLNVTARLFDIVDSGKIKPLDAVLLVYFSNVTQIADVLGSGTSIYAGLPEVTGRQTSRALMKSYTTSDLYLVNNERLMVTPTRAIGDVKVKQKVDTLPVRECLKNGSEINKEYENYRGVRVLGASMCFQNEGVVVLVEIEKAEIFAPLTTLIRTTVVGVLVAFIFGFFVIDIFIRRHIARIKNVTSVASQITAGESDLSVRVKEIENDELGYLAAVFNTMISYIYENQKKLKNSKTESEKKNMYSQSLLRISRKLEQAQKYSEIVNPIKNEVENMLGYKNLWIYLFTNDGQYAHSIAAEGTKSDTIMSETGTARLTIKGDKMLEEIATSNGIVIIEDAQTDDRVNKEIVSLMHNRTIINIPVILFDKHLGCIGTGTFGDEGVRVPSASEQKYLLMIASHMAVAISRIYLLTENKKSYDTLNKRDKELAEINKYLQHERLKSQALLASIGEGVIATDKSGNIIAINHMAETLLGINAADVVGKKAVDVYDVLTENGKEVSSEQRLISTETTTVSNVMQYHKKDDGYIPVVTTITPVILDGEAIGSIEIFRDITKEKEIEKTRGDLLSLASHQLRTPLSGTKWLIETLKKGVHGPLTSGQTEYIDELYKINERMTGLVHDMLGVLRLEGGGTIVKNENVSTKNLLHTVFETLRGAAESKQINIRVPENIDVAISTDPLLLRNILESLIGNAIIYSENGREVVLDIKQKPMWLIFSVKDSGIGIPKAEQRQIFERFYRASNAKTFDTRGSGLGLYIASMLAKKLGAHISFESEEGKGSTFYVHLPYSQKESLPESVTSV